MKRNAERTARPPLPAVASFRLRILFRGVFLLLWIATITLAIVLLRDEKERSYLNYGQALRDTHGEVLAKLRQPSGMLALLNPGASGLPPLRPLVLPFAELNFEDQNSIFQAVDQAGCAVRYPDGSRLCVAVAASPRAAGFLYLVGSFQAVELVGREHGERAPDSAHHVSVQVESPDRRQSWTIPVERLSSSDEPPVRGRFIAFETGGNTPARPVPDFRGTLWQSTSCAGAGQPPGCARRVFYAVRLPVRSARERSASKARLAWPPSDLHQVRVQVRILAPGGLAVLFDSEAKGAQPPPSLELAVESLRPGETLTISRQDLPEPAILLKGRDPGDERSSPLLLRLVSQLPVASPSRLIEMQETVATPVGSYEVRLTGDMRAVDAGLATLATRIAWYVSAMLAAIVIAWLVIEVGLIRRITALSRRAAAVSHNVQENARGGERIAQLDVSDLRGPDELGILAGGLADLLHRVRNDVEREELRARQEREMLEAVGHEILSPLQSLMVLFPDPTAPAHRYVQRMRQAVGALYGQASPREALQATRLDLVPIDLDEFLFHVASNAAFAEIEGVTYERIGRRVMVRADEFRLEDVVTHILRNAARHREPGTPICLSLTTSGKRARLRIYNVGAAIDEGLLSRIFEYGVREVEGEGEGEGAAHGRRGQGLFVARTYMAKMGGTVSARNEEHGVAFYVEVPLRAA